MPVDARPSGYRERNSTVDRTLAILDLFTIHRSSWSASAIAGELGVARSTAYRYLQTLVSAGYLMEVRGSGFQLGARLLELAHVARRGFRIVDAARPELAGLAARFRHTALLTRRIGDAIVCLDRAEPQGEHLRISYEPGTVLPVNAGASALVLLAWLPEAELSRIIDLNPLRPFTPSTVTSRDALTRRLARIRSLGYDVSLSEVDPELIGIATPVRGRSEEIVAAVSVVGMQSRLPPESREELTAALLAVSSRLGNVFTLIEGP